MTLDSLIILSGAFVALLPFLGFPNSWDTVLFALAGIFIVILGIIVRRRSVEKKRANRIADTYAESMPQRQASYNDEHAAQ